MWRRRAEEEGPARASWEQGSGLLKRLRSVLGPLGGSPEFLVLGAQRSGTTTLFEWLDGHPAVRMARPKEVHYFDVQHFRGPRWYGSHFPRRRPGRLRGEATPYYLYHPCVPARVRAELPEARLVVALRDPAERANSQFRHERRWGFEAVESFEEALGLEAERLEGQEELLLGDPLAVSHGHNHGSYVDRGRYARQLERWLEHFPREQLHVLFSEELFEEPVRVLGELADFLGIEPPAEGSLPHANSAPGERLSPALRTRILAELEEDDRALEELLGRSLPWRRG